MIIIQVNIFLHFKIIFVNLEFKFAKSYTLAPHFLYIIVSVNIPDINCFLLFTFAMISPLRIPLTPIWRCEVPTFRLLNTSEDISLITPLACKKNTSSEKYVRRWLLQKYTVADKVKYIFHIFKQHESLEHSGASSSGIN